MALRPGMTATRQAVALMERAMSSARPTTREDFTPAAGSSSNSVTTGPGRAESTSPCTPKSASTPSSWRLMACSVCGSACVVRCFGVASRSVSGSSKSRPKSNSVLLLLLAPFGAAASRRGAGRFVLAAARIGGMPTGLGAVRGRSSGGAGRGSSSVAARFLGLAARLLRDVADGALRDGGAADRGALGDLRCALHVLGAHLEGPAAREQAEQAQTTPVSTCGNGRPGMEARLAMKLRESRRPKGRRSRWRAASLRASGWSRRRRRAAARRAWRRRRGACRCARRAGGARCAARRRRGCAAMASGAAAPSVWMARSASTAPGPPNRLCVGAVAGGVEARIFRRIGQHRAQAVRAEHGAADRERRALQGKPARGRRGDPGASAAMVIGVVGHG